MEELDITVAHRYDVMVYYTGTKEYISTGRSSDNDWDNGTVHTRYHYWLAVAEKDKLPRPYIDVTDVYTIVTKPRRRWPDGS